MNQIKEYIPIMQPLFAIYKEEMIKLFDDKIGEKDTVDDRNNQNNKKTDNTQNIRLCKIV